MTREELIRDIRRLRADATADYLNIIKAMESGELSQSAKGTYFYQTFETFSRPRQSGIKPSNSWLKGGITKLKKSDLERFQRWLKGFQLQDTRTVAGVKNRLQEMEDSARAVLASFDISTKGMSRDDLSYYFQIVNLLREIADLPSDEAIYATNQLIEVNEGMTISEILDKVKTSDFDPRVADKDPERWYLVTW